MTLGATPTPAQILAELSQPFPYTFPDARTRWLADLAATDQIVFPTSFANKQSVKVVASVADAGGSSPHTFSGVNFGLAFPDRVLVACTCLRSNGTAHLDISALTIGAIAGVGTDNGETLSGGPTIGAGMFAAAVSSGTSGDIVVTFGLGTANAAGLILLSMAATTATAFANTSVPPSGAGGTSYTGTINIPNNGLLIVNAVHSNTNDATMSGVTERAAINVGTGRMEVGFDNRMGAETGRSAGSSWSGAAARGLQLRSYTQS